MTIKKLIEILQQAPDNSCKVFIENCNDNGEIGYTTQIVTSYDDNNDIRLSESA